MQPRRGTEIDGDAEWDVVKIADHAHGMRISMGQRIGYAPMRKSSKVSGLYMRKGDKLQVIYKRFCIIYKEYSTKIYFYKIG